MFMTEYQSYLMECLTALRCARIDQLEWLMGFRFSSTPQQVESDIDKLRYICYINGTVSFLPPLILCGCFLRTTAPSSQPAAPLSSLPFTWRTKRGIWISR